MHVVQGRFSSDNMDSKNKVFQKPWWLVLPTEIIVFLLCLPLPFFFLFSFFFSFLLLSFFSNIFSRACNADSGSGFKPGAQTHNDKSCSVWQAGRRRHQARGGGGGAQGVMACAPCASRRTPAARRPARPALPRHWPGGRNKKVHFFQRSQREWVRRRAALMAAREG